MGYWALQLAVLATALGFATLFYQYVENPLVMRFSKSGSFTPVPVPVFAEQQSEVIGFAEESTTGLLALHAQVSGSSKVASRMKA